MNLRELKKRNTTGNREWFDVRNETNEQPEVFIYDEIGRGFFGGGVAPDDLIKAVKGMKLKANETLNVRINSPGGDVFDGNTIYNYLRSIKQQVTVTIDGLAASAASIIAMAGDTIRMPENSFLMIHNPWMFVAGDSRVMRKVADDLDEIREGAIKTYLSHSNVERDELVQMLDDETWLGADKAIELGFADELIEPVRAAALAKFHLQDYFSKIPDGISEIQKKERMERERMRSELNILKA